MWDSQHQRGPGPECALMPGATILATTLLMLRVFMGFKRAWGSCRASVSLPLRSRWLFQEGGIEPSDML